MGKLPTVCIGCPYVKTCGGKVVCKRRISHTVILALATLHSLEVYSAIFALVWGVFTAVFWHYLEHPSTQGLLTYVGGKGWLFGVWPALWGGVGLYAIHKGNRKLRATSAGANALFWWLLAGWFFAIPEPRVTSAIAAYFCAAAAEGWVYVRVEQCFDDLVKDIRKHRRGASCGRASSQSS